MKIDKDLMVALSYTLKVDGEVVDAASAEAPLKFVFGQGMLLPKFESNIEGKVVGDEFEFVLSAADGYGETIAEAVVDLPLDTFKVDGQVEEGLLTVGNTIPMMDGEGNRLSGLVTQVGEDAVTLDFNHPLAGMELHFSGQVVEVRPTDESDFASSCGGDCGDDCGDDCGSACGCGCN